MDWSCGCYGEESVCLRLTGFFFILFNLRYGARLNALWSEEHKAWKGFGKDVFHPRTHKGTGEVEAEDYPHLAAGRLQLEEPIGENVYGLDLLDRYL